MFFTFPQPQHVLNMFLIFLPFSVSCSHRKRFLYKKKECISFKRYIFAVLGLFHRVGETVAARARDINPREIIAE